MVEIESSIVDSRYSYIHKGSLQAIDIHHIVLSTNSVMAFILNLSALLLIPNLLSLFLAKDKSLTILLWSLLLGAFLVKLIFQKRVEKESVIIMPALGVQLETHYGSGREIRRFVPISNILKAVVNECVTPVTCYWSLSLLVREEEELMLVFNELRPPVKMLIPIWKALCAATDSKEDPDTFT